MDFIGRMTSLTDIDGSVFAYEFDGEGNRLSQSLNDCLSKRFVYDGADVLLELNPINGVAYAWVNGPGIDQPIERLLFIDGAPRARRVFHADALGSVAALTDPSGLVTQSYAYSAFGSLRSSTGHDPNRVTYTAREQLGDSQGWMYYRYRVYSFSLGRFSTPDLLGFADGVNVYAYVANNPVLFVDSLGLRVVNNSKIPVLVKLEKGLDQFVILEPGGIFEGRQDGIVFPNGLVFKNNDRVDIEVCPNGRTVTPESIRANYWGDVGKGFLEYWGFEKFEPSGWYRLGDPNSIVGRQWKPSQKIKDDFRKAISEAMERANVSAQ